MRQQYIQFNKDTGEIVSRIWGDAPPAYFYQLAVDEHIDTTYMKVDLADGVPKLISQ